MQRAPLGRRHERRRPEVTVESAGDPVRLPHGFPFTGPVTFTITQAVTGTGSPDTPSTGVLAPVSKSLGDGARGTTSVSPTSSAPPPDATTAQSSQPIAFTSSQSAPTTTSVSSGNSTSGATTSTGLSNGAIAGIVIGILFVIALITVFLIRKASVFKRKKQRATWGGNIFVKTENSTEKLPPASSPGAQYAFQPQAVLPPPPMTYNNVESNTVVPVAGTSATTSPGGTVATVRCTFIPNLPDELSITTGEVVRVLAEYDDGWALCAHGSGEQGMVPLECLDKLAPGQAMPSGGADWRNAQRASSLASAGNARY